MTILIYLVIVVIWYIVVLISRPALGWGWQERKEFEHDERRNLDHV